MSRKILIFDHIEELNHFAAQKFVELGNRAISTGGRFTVALAGGSTPKSLYRLLASENFKTRIEWNKVFFFFGDERNVPIDSEKSNFRMASENLLRPLKISGENIFRWLTELKNAETVAGKYEKAIRIFFDIKENSKSFPRFDLFLLGMGDDGHTASLFPFTEALHATEKIAAANYVEKLNDCRLTLTFPVINNAANIMFLVSGEKKAPALKEVLEGGFQPEKFPAQVVKPEHGNLFWMADKYAARLLQNRNDI